MSLESYSALDESSLRALLDGTVDLDERRLIRSALRELRRREIEDMEAALASKRFRPTRQQQQQEDKENHHRSESSEKLDVLSQKLQSIKDIDELTRMLRAASEYEERKIIRAAIRQIRDEQQQGTADTFKAPGHRLEPERVEPQGIMGTGDTEGRERVKAQIQDLCSQQTNQGRELQRGGSNSGMVLVLDPLVKDDGSLLIQPVLSHCQRSEGSATSLPTRCSSDVALTSEKIPAGSAFRGRLDSGASDRSHSPFQRRRLDSGASEPSVGSDLSDSGARKRSDSTTSDHSLCSEERRPAQEVHEVHEVQAVQAVQATQVYVGGDTSGTDSEAEGHINDQDQPDGGVLSRRGHQVNGLLNGCAKGKIDVLKEKITSNRDLPLTHGKAKEPPAAGRKDGVLEAVGRSNSVRDRMRRFNDAAQSPANVPAPRATPPRRGTSSRAAAGMFTPAAPPPSSAGQWQSSRGGTTAAAPAESHTHGAAHSEEDQAPGRAAAQQEAQQEGDGAADPDMKTFLTIEIKDGRSSAATSSSAAAASSTSSARGNIVPISSLAPRFNANSLGQRTELTLGLRATPFKISSSGLTSGSSTKMETEPVVASEPVFSVAPCVQVPAAVVPNGSSSAGATQAKGGKVTAEQLAAVEDEDLLDKMLDESKDFEERKLIRAAMRDLRKKKREAMLGCTQEEIDQREKERETRLQELRQQREERSQKGRGGAGAGEVVMRKVEKSADGSSLSQVTKTNRFAQSDNGSRSTRSTVVESSFMQKTDRGTVQSKSYSFTSSSSSSSSSSNASRKVGSVFDREDDTSVVERRQAERRKELMRAQTMPKTSATQARKAMMEKLEKEGGGTGNQALAKVNRVQRSTSFGVPNANSIKQMLLDWCRAKTRSYEHVEIQNFSSSWSNGMAFCALVHNFFPDAFDYSALSPSNRRHNFETAFSAAEKLVDCPQLLDVDDMVKMREPDWKCVYTYLQEFYRGLVTKGLVKTKNSS
ncbi:smoothelin isoform X2 [Nelusetta ayraudi]|uniref:smoothelin isoform X2 n=1 Tax=Nelusetta ayraudi TaxID=303726 RepID=UPI003F721049